MFPLLYFFAKGGGRSGTEPVRAYILAYFIAVACISIGEGIGGGDFVASCPRISFSYETHGYKTSVFVVIILYFVLFSL